MDLKSGCFYWPRIDHPAPDFPPLSDDLECDVAVIGAGITGALAAHFLTEAGLRVVLLDRRNVCEGSTVASTGLLQYEIDTPLVLLMEQVGRDAAVRSYRLCAEAIPAFERLLETLGDDCGFRRRNSLYLAALSGDIPLFEQECTARRACGIGVDYLSRDELEERFGFSRPAALLSYEAAEIDPYRLTSALVRRAVSRGLRVFGRTAINRYVADNDAVTLTTNAGRRVRAPHVVFATGYETPEFLDRSLQTLKSTYAFVSEPVEDFGRWRDRCLVWESAEPYFYMRSTPDGRIMAGGEDVDFIDPVRRDALIPAKSHTLRQKIHALFPEIDVQVACAWAGAFAETADGLPFVGPHPKFPRGLFALGYGGNGITFALLAARILRDHLTGTENPDLELFRFDR